LNSSSGRTPDPTSIVSSMSSGSSSDDTDPRSSASSSSSRPLSEGLARLIPVSEPPIVISLPVPLPDASTRSSSSLSDSTSSSSSKPKSLLPPVSRSSPVPLPLDRSSLSSSLPAPSTFELPPATTLTSLPSGSGISCTSLSPMLFGAGGPPSTSLPVSGS